MLEKTLALWYTMCGNESQTFHTWSVVPYRERRTFLFA